MQGMIQSFPIRHNNLATAEEADLSFLCHEEERLPFPPHARSLPEMCLCCWWGRPAGHVTGHFHCKEGRQEAEVKPDLSTASLNSGPQQGRVTVNSHNMGEALGEVGGSGSRCFPLCAIKKTDRSRPSELSKEKPRN